MHRFRRLRLFFAFRPNGFFELPRRLRAGFRFFVGADCANISREAPPA